MVEGIRASKPCGLNKGHGSKFRVGSQVRQETPEEGQRTYQLKCCDYNNKDEDNSPKTLNDKILLEWLKVFCQVSMLVISTGLSIKILVNISS